MVDCRINNWRSCFIRLCPDESRRKKGMLFVHGKEKEVKERGRLRGRPFYITEEK